MDYETFQASIKDYKNKSLIHNDVSANEAVKDWHAKYFDTAVSAYSKMLIADEMKHSEDVEKFGADFASLVGLIDDATDDKEAIAKELKSIDTIARSKADAALKRLSHGTDTKEGYTAAINAYKAEHLEHGEWKKHKYIRIENGRYIYPEDEKKESNKSVTEKVSEKIQSTVNSIKNAGHNIAMKTSPEYVSNYYKKASEARQLGREKLDEYMKDKEEEAAPTKESVKKEVLEYFISNNGTFKDGDNSMIFKDKMEAVGLTQKDLGEILSEAKKRLKHSNENSQQSYFAAIDAYKQQKAVLEHQSFNSRDAYRAAVAEYEGSHLEHHGILGQKWGVRRFQNPDGSLTSAGKKRYSESDLDEIKKASEKGGKFFGVAGGIINGLRKKREIDKRNAKAEVDDKETIKDLAEVAAQNKPSGLADGKASSLFNKKEFDDIGKDPELDDLMFLELHTYNRSNLIGKEYGKEYNAEFERFKKDPKNYEIPKSMIDKQFDNDYTEAEKDAVRAKTGTKFGSSGDGFKSPYSKETQTSKLENAKKNGMYDLTFLEIVQNDYYANHFTAKDKKRMLSEYEKYLKNGGQKYWDEIHKDESRW